jgi:hypothetical protein
MASRRRQFPTMLAVRKRRALRDPDEFAIPPLSADPEYQVVAAELARYEGRLKQAEEREAKARARARGAGKQPTASDLLGGFLSSANPADEIEAARVEAFSLRQEIYDRKAKLDEIVGDRSYHLALRFKAEHAEALRAIFDGLVTIADGVEAIVVARQRRIAAGYKPADYALPTQIPPEVQALGHPRRGESIAGVVRRWLEAEGIIREGTI